MLNLCCGSNIGYKKGQVKIIEALITCVILMSGLSFVVFYGGIYKTIGTTELEEVGENIISVIDDQEVLKKIVFSEESVDSEIKSLIEALLPPDVFFILSIASSEQDQITSITNIVSHNLSSSLDSVAIQQVKTVSMPITRKEFLELDVMLIIDRSGSMGWEDPPRIYYAKEAAKTFVDQLNASRDMVGLTSFGWSGTTDHHLTHNFVSVKSEIDDLNAYGATNMGEGLEKANDEFVTNQRNDTVTASILLSDGFANVDRDGQYYDEDDDRTPVFQYVREEANVAGNMSVALYTIGLGNSTDHFDEDLLKEIVRNGGHYYHAPSAEDLEEIYEMIALDLLFQVQYDIVTIELTLIKAG